MATHEQNGGSRTPKQVKPQFGLRPGLAEAAQFDVADTALYPTRTSRKVQILEVPGVALLSQVQPNKHC